MMFLFIFSLYSYLLVIDSSSLSNPLTKDSNISSVIPDYHESKRRNTKAYHETKPKTLESIKIIDHTKSCDITFKLRWSTPLGSSVLSTPIIYPSSPSGKKQIIQNTFYQYIEMISHDGFKPWGWPVSFESSSFQGSPIIYDLDGDGYNDIGTASLRYTEVITIHLLNYIHIPDNHLLLI